MGIFSSKKSTTPSETATSEKSEKRTVLRVSPRVLLRPRVTEKATTRSSDHVYTFIVSRGATKREIAQAVEETFKVTPQKVRVAPIPRKSLSLKARRGTTSLGKKAYVYLRKEDTIEFI